MANLFGRKPKERNPEFDKWRFRRERAEKIREKWEQKYKVKECENFILGFQDEEQSPNTPVFNHLLATLKTIKPNIFFSNPKFHVRPKGGIPTQAEEDGAKMAEGLLEVIAGQNNCLKTSGALATWQTFSRIGVLKQVYDPRPEPNPNAGRPIVRTNEAYEPILNPETQEPEFLTDPITGDVLVEPDEIITDEAYRYDWVDAANMLLPDEGPNPSRWTWIGEEVIVPLDDAKADKRFNQKLRTQLKANETVDKEIESKMVNSETIEDRESAMLRYYELYDIREKKLRVYAEGQDFDGFLMNKPMPDGIEDHPYALHLGYTPILAPEPSPWPLPLVYPWLPVQREYNIRRKQITQGAKRSARKVYYTESTFPDEDQAKKALQSNEDMEAVKVNSIGNVPVGTKDPEVNGTISMDIGMLQNDWRIIAGQPGARLSNPDSSTATEATFVERAANLKDNEMLEVIQDWLGMAGRKMLQLVKATMTMEMVVKMRGMSDSEFKSYAQRVYKIPEIATEFLPGLKELFRERFGKEMWKKVTRDELQFEADVSVVPGSFRPRNLAFERKEWLEFLQIIGTAPHLALSRELLRETASKFEHISERMLDELVALSEKMIGVQANQAGRNQGGSANGGGQAPGGGNPVQQMLAGMGGG